MPVPLDLPAAAGRRGHQRLTCSLGLAGLAWVCIGAVIPAQADDRPFLRTTHALVSTDEDGWEISVMAVANRHGQALSTQIERDLGRTHKLEFEFGRSPNALGPEPEQGVRLRSLWVSPTETGWGLASKLGLEPRRSAEDDGRRTQAQGVLSWSPAPRLWAHLNLGWQWRQPSHGGTQRSSVSALALQHEWTAQRWFYAEAAGSGDGRDRLLHLGLRHWLRPQQLALDTGVGRQSGTERPGQFVAINLSFFDLDL
jgi:hypothetical protein